VCGAAVARDPKAGAERLERVARLLGKSIALERRWAEQGAPIAVATFLLVMSYFLEPGILSQPRKRTDSYDNVERKPCAYAPLQQRIVARSGN
jgi:hypothetical protein